MRSARRTSEREAEMNGFDTIIEGVLLGGVYALFALGLSLIFGIMRLVNLAHGDLILLAAYLVLSVTTVLGVPLAAASLLIVVVMFAAGFALQRLVLERVLGDDILPPLLVTFGLSIVIQNGLLLGYGADSRRLQAGAFESSSVTLAPGLSIGLAPLAALLTAVAAVARLLYAFEAVIIGGLGSLWGTLAGGIVLGLAQTIGARINPEWQILAGHITFLAVLMVRPRGLFPSRRP